MNSTTFSWSKAFIRNFVRRRGFEIRKFPRSTFRTVPVFDVAIRLLMAKQGASLNFIQVGANDGSYGDPLRDYILKYPWRGVLVEPQETAFDALRENYAAARDRLIFENAAISHSTSILMYKAPRHYIGNELYSASVVSTDPRVVAKQLGLKTSQLDQFSVPSITLDDLIKKHDLKTPDLLQIDAEGYDWHVLKTLTLANVKPSIIQFEHGHLSSDGIDRIAEFLNVHNYRIYWGGHQGDSVALSNNFLTTCLGER
jgi:FkbM family methyltransferase